MGFLLHSRCFDKCQSLTSAPQVYSTVPAEVLYSCLLSLLFRFYLYKIFSTKPLPICQCTFCYLCYKYTIFLKKPSDSSTKLNISWFSR